MDDFPGAVDVELQEMHIDIHLSVCTAFPTICLFVFVLRFYGPVNPMGSCWARSVYITTRLLGRPSPLSG